VVVLAGLCWLSSGSAIPAAAAGGPEPHRGGAYVAVFLSGIAIFGIFLFLTYYMQLIKGDSPFTTGLLFLPLIGCILISSNLSSIVLLPRWGRAP